MREGAINSIAVIGTGFIGFSWAHIFSRNAIETRLYDDDTVNLNVGYEKLVSELNFFKNEGLINEHTLQTALNKIKLYNNIEKALDGVEYVQECVPENLKIKQQVFSKLDNLTPSEVILASSASALPMTDIAKYVNYPQRCIVVHPTNPPHLIPLVEIVPGKKTDQRSINVSYDFMESIFQKPIICNKEIYGYVLNRLQFALVQEAFYLAKEGVASCADIDKCISEGLGMRWAFTGPFIVEELNANNIEEDLRKYGESMKNLISTLGSFKGPDEEDIKMASNGVKEIFGDKTHDQVLSWRNRMLLMLRALKQENQCL